jgi:hypothetical protein
VHATAKLIVKERDGQVFLETALHPVDRPLVADHRLSQRQTHAEDTVLSASANLLFGQTKGLTRDTHGAGGMFFSVASRRGAVAGKDQVRTDIEDGTVPEDTPDDLGAIDVEVMGPGRTRFTHVEVTDSGTVDNVRWLEGISNALK